MPEPFSIGTRAGDLEEANRVLRIANERLDSFTYVISHDIKAPARAVDTILRRLQEEHADLPDAARALINDAKAANDRLRSLITGLLEFSRASRADLANAQPVGLNAALQMGDCTTRFRGILTERGGTLEYVGQDVIVHAHVTGLCQVLGNLVQNAIKHNTNPHPIVRIRAQASIDGNMIEVAVEDNGSGFPPDVLASMDRMTTTTRGFGLVIAKRTVELVGGKLSLGRTPEGGGAVYITLPGSVAKTSVGQATMSADVAASEVIGTILLVGMTVLMVAALGVVVLNTPAPADAPHIDVDILPFGGEVLVQHIGGESVSLEDGEVHVTSNGVDSVVKLTSFRGAIGDAWETGESLCISGVASTCLQTFDGTTITSVRIVVRNAIVRGWAGSAVTAAPDIIPYLVPPQAVPGEGENITFTALIYNNGTRATPAPFTVEFFLDDNLTPFSTHTVAAPLDAATNTTLMSNPWKATGGTHVVRVFADASAALTELNEMNNEQSYRFLTSSADLTGMIESITPGQPIPGESTVFTLRVYNNGTGTAAAPFAVAFYLDDSLSPLSTQNVTASLKAGASTTVNSTPWQATLGAHAVRTVVDPTQQVIEIDETNNEGLTMFASATPDLLVNVESFTPSVVGEGAAMTFTARVYNNGTRSTGGEFSVTFSIDGSSLPFSTKSVAVAVAAGANTTVTSDEWIASSGSHSVSVVVDAGGQLVELNETNNNRTREFTVAVAVYDPGFPYEDVNNDRRFAAGVDSAIARSAVTGGTYTAIAGNGLVIPPSVGPISVNGQLSYATSGGGSLSIGVDITSKGKLTLTSGAAMYVGGIRAESSNSELQITAGTDLSAENAELVSRQALNVVSAGNVDLVGAALNARTNAITINTTSSGWTILVANARFIDSDNTARASPIGVSIIGTPASGAINS